MTNQSLNFKTFVNSHTFEMQKRLKKFKKKFFGLLTLKIKVGMIENH